MSKARNMEQIKSLLSDDEQILWLDQPEEFTFVKVKSRGLSKVGSLLVSSTLLIVIILPIYQIFSALFGWFLALIFTSVIFVGFVIFLTILLYVVKDEDRYAINTAVISSKSFYITSSEIHDFSKEFVKHFDSNVNILNLALNAGDLAFRTDKGLAFIPMQKINRIRIVQKDVRTNVFLYYRAKKGEVWKFGLRKINSKEELQAVLTGKFSYQSIKKDAKREVYEKIDK